MDASQGPSTSDPDDAKYFVDWVLHELANIQSPLEMSLQFVAREIRATASSDDKLAESLEDALAQIFGTTGTGRAPVQAARVKAASLPKGLTGLPVSPAAKAREHYDRLIKASRDGNWTGFGMELQALGDALRKLERAAK